jgi:hypothetical protein
MIPLNFVAKKIMEFFNGQMKSRLPRSPYGYDGRLRLEGGLSGPIIPDVKPAQPQPFDTRPAA